jgi:hypothetical protein
VVFFEVVIEDEADEENSFGQIFVGVTEKESYDVKVFRIFSGCECLASILFSFLGPGH